MNSKSKKNYQNRTRLSRSQTKNSLLIGTLQSLQRQWILAFVVVIAGIVLLTNASAWASPILAPINQTVPIPTATPTPTPVPTVTPAPTSTPEAESTEEPTDNQEDEEILDDDGGSFFGDDEATSPEDEENADDESASESSASESSGSNSSSDAESNSGSDSSGNTESESSSAGTTSDSGSDTGSETTVAAPTGLTANVAVIVLNIREQPSLESPVLGTVFQDDELDVLGQNGPWWMVCCAIGSDQPAWVNPDFLEPNFDLAEVDELLPVIGQQAEEATTASGNSVQAAASSPNLELEMSLNPRYVWQNLTFDLEFVVRNIGKSTVSDVVLRDELLTDLEFITAKISNDGNVVKETLDNGNSLVSVRWDELMAGEEAKVAFTLRIVGDLEDGYVVDNLAVVNGAETSSTTAGISIGLPPASLPVFK